MGDNNTLRRRHGTPTPKPHATRVQPSRTTKASNVRAGVEVAVLLVTTFWCCAELLHVGCQNEATALMILSTATVVSRVFFKLPQYWVNAVRSCSDSGLLYGTILLPIALAARLVVQLQGSGGASFAQSEFEYHDLVLWVTIGIGFNNLALVAIGDTKFVLMAFVTTVTICLTTASWQLSNPHNIANGSSLLPWTLPLPTMSLHVGLNFAVVYGLQFFVIRYLKRSFTIGEAMFVILALGLSVSDFVVHTLTVLKLFDLRGLFVSGATLASRQEVYVALQGGLLGVLSAVGVLMPFFTRFARTDNETITVNARDRLPSDVERRRLVGSASFDWSTLSPHATAGFYLTLALYLGLFVSPWCGFLLGRNPVIWVLEYTFQSVNHLYVVAYWLVSLGVGLPIIHMVAVSDLIPLIIIRKLYHLLAFVMFAPVLVYERHFLALAFGIATALLLIVEYIRICRVPPFGTWLHKYMRSYTDSRDEGVAILTHLYLLCGCASSLWACKDEKTLAPFAGLLILGAGDAAGAIVGSTIGTHFWMGGRKTLEGTVAAVLSTLLAGWMVCAMSNGEHTVLLAADEAGLFKVVLAVCLTCLLEAFTKQIDNLVLPVFFMTTLELAT